MKRGDIILYPRSGQSAFEDIIAFVSAGKYIHTEVAISATRSVGEISINGAAEHTVDFGRKPVFVDVKVMVPGADIVAGMRWVEAMRDANIKGTNKYAVKDLFNSLFRWAHLSVRIPSEDNEWDCSDFVTRYLLAAHAEGPLGKLANDPSTVSPNDIARAFGVK